MHGPRSDSDCRTSVLILAETPGQEEHRGGAFHPERPDRVDAVRAGIADLHLGSDVVPVPVVPAGESILSAVHSTRYLTELRLLCEGGGGELDPDTYAGPGSWTAACGAAGAGVAAIGALRERGDGIAFVVARPPGHHAEAESGMGFCLLNNVAIAAATIKAAGEKVLIVDWDVHHGNGTQAIFWDDPDVLYVSTHEWPLYPGTGRAREVGGVHALGSTVNIPLPAGATGDVLRRAFEEVAAPIVAAFAPDWVLVSCGFDAHRDDPLADLALSSADFGLLALDVRQFVGRAGRMALFLEGGYDLGALRRSVAATVGALVGEGNGPEDPTFGGPGADHVLLAGNLRERAIARAAEEAGDVG